MSENLTDALGAAVTTIQNRQQPTETTTSNGIAGRIEDRSKWRNIIGFWMLGMCNNYGYVVMLTAAFDIIKQFHPDGYGLYRPARDCSIMSTGVLLLADTIPSMTIKMIVPFLPYYINIRMVFVSLLSACGFILVAYCQSEWQVLVGIVCTSMSCGLGETSLLAYTPRFKRYTLAAWSSGTGAAGVLGALTYTALLGIGFTARTSMLLMLVIPALQAFAFYVLLQETRPLNSTFATSTTSLITHNDDENILFRDASPNITMKLHYLPNLFKYVLPLFTVYISEYFINQGLYELIYFPNIWLNHEAQYRWLQVDYQIGVLISRTSIALFEFKHIWLMSLLQSLNVVYFLYEAVYLSTPSIWMVFGFVFWEGLLGGLCYVNTFNRITREVPVQFRSFGMGVTTVGESFGVVAAGLLAIPIHNVICQLPLYYTYY